MKVEMAVSWLSCKCHFLSGLIFCRFSLNQLLIVWKTIRPLSTPFP